MSDAIRAVHLKVTGTTALVMANGQLADPANNYTRQIASITSKSRMTDEDQRRKEILQWRGHLYEEDGEIIIPAQNLVRCLHNAGKMFRLGPAVQRAISITTPWFPLIHDGGPDIDKLVCEPKYTWRAIVNLSPTKGPKGGKGPKVWPRFTPWGFDADLSYFPEALDLDAFQRVIHAAGAGEGIGDARRLGYGRFRTVLS